MTLARPVLRDDPFAAPAWNAITTILALEELRVGEAPSDEEWAGISRLADFIDSVIKTPEDSISPEASARFRILRRKPDIEFFRRLLDDLRNLVSERKSYLATRAAASLLQDAVLEVLQIFNYCRVYR